MNDRAPSASPNGIPAPVLPGLRAAVTAPAKCILLGEHAVVYGQPCLSVALDLRTHIIAHRVGDRFAVNGYSLNKRHHVFMVHAVERDWDGDPVRFEVQSHIPSASGTGSSAALTVGTVAALHRLKDQWDPAAIARAAFGAERAAQGGGSPNDTSVSTAGGAVLLAPEKHNEGGLRHLWTVESEEADLRWEVHKIDVPEIQLVVGQTGIRARTATQVQKVRRFVERSSFGRDTVNAVGDLVWQALDAVRQSDAEALGKLMERNQAHLHTMGVNHPRLQGLIDAAHKARGTLGAKLTGAGGGGAIVVLTTDPEAACKAIELAGGNAFRAGATNAGVAPEPTLESLPPDHDEAEPAADSEAAAPASRQGGDT